MMFLKRAGLPGAMVAVFLVALLIVLTFAGAHTSTEPMDCGELVVGATTPTGASCGTTTVELPDGPFVAEAYLTVLSMPFVLALGLFVAAMRRRPRFLHLAYWWTTWGTVLAAGTIAVFLLAVVIHPRSEFRVDLGSVALHRGELIVTGEANGRFPYSGVSDTPELRQRAEQSFGPRTTFRATGDLQFEAVLPRITPKVVLLAAISALWHLLSLLGVLWSLRAVVARALRGSPFDGAAVRGMRQLAFAVLAAGPGAAVISHLTSHALLRAAGGSGSGLAWNLDWWPILTAFLIFALAEIWRYGNDLQRDAEGTI